jgi:hypothetical protein
MSETQIPELITPAEAAAALHTTEGVLATWRSAKRYSLRYVKVGSKVYYKREDVFKFIEARTMTGVEESKPHRSRRTAA